VGALLRSVVYDAVALRADLDDSPSPRRQPSEGYRGEATLETYTVSHHDSDGAPARAVLVVRTPDGRRTWTGVEDPDLLLALESQELLGSRCRLHDKGIDVIASR
jgi:hypothetical protein